MTIDENEVTERINDSLSVIGKCKNLLKPTLETETHNGVTFTKNDDGTYSLSGSRTDTSSSAYISFIIDYPLEKGRYKLTGALDENNNIRCIIKESGSENKNIYDYGKGAVLDISKPNTTITLMIVSIDDTSQTRIIKPMLTTNLSATYDDFVPYTGEGETLTHDVAEIKNDLSNFTSGLYIDGDTDWNTIKTSGMYFYNGWSGSGGSNKPTETKSIGMVFVLNSGIKLLQFVVLESGNSYFRSGTVDELGNWTTIS